MKPLIIMSMVALILVAGLSGAQLRAEDAHHPEKRQSQEVHRQKIKAARKEEARRENQEVEPKRVMARSERSPGMTSISVRVTRGRDPNRNRLRSGRG